MKLKFTKIILMLAVAGMVSACSDKNEKSPDQMVRTGIQRMMVKDNQFNFSGSYKIEFNKQNGEINEDEFASEVDMGMVPPSAINLAPPTEVNMPVPSEPTLEPTFDSQIETDYDDMNQHKKMERLYNNAAMQFLEKFGHSFSVPFTGAVDMQKGQMEFIPEARYEDKNALVSFKFPIHIDFNNLSLYVDASAITNLYDTAPNNKIVIGDKYIQLAVPQDKIQHIPISDLLKGLPESMDACYASLNPNAFKKVNIDEFGKTLEAKYQVSMTIDFDSSMKCGRAMLESFSKNLKEAASKAGKDNKYKPEDYIQLQNILDQVALIYSDNNNILANTPMGAFIEQFKKFFVQYAYNFYFDSKGRIIGTHYQLELPMDMLVNSSKKPKGTMKIDYKSQIEYTGSPKFTMQPTPQNSVDIISYLINNQ